MNTPTSESESTSAFASAADSAADSVASPPSPSSSMASLPTRTGKIARLPKAVRDRLNQQLCDGVPGKDLVAWMNRLSEVQEVLIQQFHGQMITEQNLSSWRQGGYVDWLEHEECRDWARRLSDEAEDLLDDAGALPLMERIGTRMEVILGQAVEKMKGCALETAQEVKQLLDLSKEVARHRRLALAAAKERRQQREKEAAEEDPTTNAKIFAARRKAVANAQAKQKLAQQEEALTAGVSPETEAYLVDQLEEMTLDYMRGSKPHPGFAKDYMEVAGPLLAVGEFKELAEEVKGCWETKDPGESR